MGKILISTIWMKQSEHLKWSNLLRKSVRSHEQAGTARCVNSLGTGDPCASVSSVLSLGAACSGSCVSPLVDGITCESVSY